LFVVSGTVPVKPSPPVWDAPCSRCTYNSRYSLSWPWSTYQATRVNRLV